MQQSTNWVNSEGRFIRNGGVLAEEDDLIDHLTSLFLPPLVQVVFYHYTLPMLQHSNPLINEALHIILNDATQKIRNSKVEKLDRTR